ncbi:methionyl-tRNA synthetase [Dictyostelium purpureum]|uniref:methionine--tRNA ligase n=1 Tax=Dictyostelium purpureum TaxID=5786 RepID=F0Z7C2_DICPU|nr:methionyl-tRNA synthetase [Dictyostelium purpureum]EGC40152.1 methionyl-tRNA synthetase [Dictyostelium purpureum]|eukprot:XP_003283342.1 methionyl-tRNA synthetase [Dictyostelium purpureum]
MSAPAKDPVHPKTGERNILITSALPYVNNVPHLGNLVGSTLSADVYARYCRLKNYNVIYIWGTDEYGTATETKALQEKCTPKEICDKYHKIHKEIYEWFNISFDKFDIFKKLNDNGYTLTQEIEQLYCEQTCKMFLADRYVEGICPHCQYEDARGDQCDKCTKLLNPTDLINPRCKMCSKPPIIKSTKHIFIDLPQLQSSVQEFVKRNSADGNWSENSIQITKTWVDGELKPRCITRDLKWGTPVPLEEFKEKVFYVWFDAPIGYISITAEYTKDWEKWWKNPEDVKLVQFMGKDNVPFHTVIFPASQIGTKDSYTLLNNLSTTEYLNYETGKFSKSRGTGVFGDGAKNTGIPSEVWRFYLLSNRPESSDSVFSWDDFNAKNNELLNNFGNLVNRVLKMISTTYQGTVPTIDNTKLNEADHKFINEVNQNLDQYFKSLEEISLKEGLKITMAISKLGNSYMQENKPWEGDKERSALVLAVLTNLIKLLATLFEPYIPSLTDRIHQQLNVEPTKYSTKFDLHAIPGGHELSKQIEPLVKKIDAADLKKWRTQFSGLGPEFPIDLKIGTITEVNDHPSAEHLYIIKVNLGGDVNKTVVSGIKNNFEKSELLNKKLAVVCNLKPSKFKGVLSEAMIIVADDGKGAKDSLSFLVPKNPDAVVAGSKIAGKGMSIQPKPSIDYQKEFLHYDLTCVDHVISYNKTPLLINQSEPLVSEKLSTGKIR